MEARSDRPWPRSLDPEHRTGRWLGFKARRFAFITLTQGWHRTGRSTSPPADTALQGSLSYPSTARTPEDEVTAAQEKVDNLRGHRRSGEVRPNLTVRAPLPANWVEIGEFQVGDDVPDGAAVAHWSATKAQLSLSTSAIPVNDIAVGQASASHSRRDGQLQRHGGKINKVSYISPRGTRSTLRSSSHLTIPAPTAGDGTTYSRPRHCRQEAPSILCKDAGPSHYATRKIVTHRVRPLLTDNSLRYANMNAGTSCW